MTGAYDEVGARLRALVIDGDLGRLRDHVDALDGSGVAAARAWIGGHHDFDDHPGPPELAHLSYTEAREHRRAMTAGEILLVGRLEPPVAAVKAVMRFSRLWCRPDHPEMLAAFAERDRAWAEAFAKAADATPPPAEGDSSTLALLLRHVVLCHDLTVPVGRLFHTSWIRFDPRREGEDALTDAVRADPLMPDVLLRQLESGECGQNPALPDTVGALVDEGLLDRSATLTVVLEQLTGSQRVTSQRVLAGIAARLRLSADEVPGGLSYLLGVLSTADGSVAKVVLPLAIESVRTSEELTGLTRVVGVRSEKGVRQLLLRALSPRALGKRLDPADLLSAIDVLAADDQDAAQRAAYDLARLALGSAPATTEVDTPDALGLWDLAPALVDPGPADRWEPAPLRDRTWTALRTGASSADPGFVEDLLSALVLGSFSETDLLATAHELAIEGTLSPTRAAGVLEPLFLGGVMRQTWPVALHVADLCCVGHRVAPGLDKLLRMLASYAAEPPRPVDLPPHVLRLASGRSKAAHEAARLAAALGSRLDPGEAVPLRHGLWTDTTERPPWGLAYPPKRDLATLGRRILSTPHWDVRGVVRRSVMTSLLLDELAALVVEHGPDAVRAAVVSDPEHGDGDLAQAVALWASGLLTPESYWAMARSSRTAPVLVDDDGDGGPRHTQWRPLDGIHLDPPAMPYWWTQDWRGSGRLAFLHMCEVLLLLERGGRPVSTPDVIDGSLDLELLRARLDATPYVGPLDLRLALGRLRPTTPEDAGRVTSTAATHRDLTCPTRDREDDAADVARRWITEGGLRLTPRRTLQPGGTGWDFDAEAPVPWHSCAALEGAYEEQAPEQLLDDVWSMPGRPDLVVRHGCFRSHDKSVADVGGSLGVTGWESLLLTLGSEASRYVTYAPPDFESLVRLQDQDRLDPVMAARAATARWDEGLPDFIGDALGWDRAFLRGAMRGLWPAAVAVVEAGLCRHERPAGLDALVAVLRRHVHEAPREAVPAFLDEE